MMFCLLRGSGPRCIKDSQVEGPGWMDHDRYDVRAKIPPGTSEVRFKGWFQQQLGCRLRHPIPYGWDSQWPFAAAGLWDHYPPHGLRLIRFSAKVFPDAGQPSLQPLRLVAVLFDENSGHARKLRWSGRQSTQRQV